VLLVVFVVLDDQFVVVGRVGDNGERDVRNGLTEQLAFFAEPKALDAILVDGRYRHRLSP